jgi:hypothetical protein
MSNETEELARIVAKLAIMTDAPTEEDQRVAGMAWTHLPASDHPDGMKVLADIARDLRRAKEFLGYTPSPPASATGGEVEALRAGVKTITLCGSSRFPEAFALANMHLSMLGHIVIGLGCFGHADHPTGARFLTSDGDETTPEKQSLDQLHFRKIDLADEIFVVNPGGYIGSSTKREIAHAEQQGKAVNYLFPPLRAALSRQAEGGGDDAALCKFGHHPEAEIDFSVEVEALEGMAYEVKVGLASQWPFWSRLSQALRIGRENDWFAQPHLEANLRALEQSITSPAPAPSVTGGVVGTPGAKEAFSALDLADAIIERHCGMDTPQDWHDAYQDVARARSEGRAPSAAPDILELPKDVIARLRAFAVDLDTMVYFRHPDNHLDKDIATLLADLSTPAQSGGDLDVGELVADLKRRAEACYALRDQTEHRLPRARLEGKGNGYDHAAELVAALQHGGR